MARDIVYPCQEFNNHLSGAAARRKIESLQRPWKITGNYRSKTKGGGTIKHCYICCLVLIYCLVLGLSLLGRGADTQGILVMAFTNSEPTTPLSQNYSIAVLIPQCTPLHCCFSDPQLHCFCCWVMNPLGFLYISEFTDTVFISVVIIVVCVAKRGQGISPLLVEG